MTTFGDQVFQFGGIPVVGSGMLPIMGSSGRVFFVDPANGSDSNSGLTPKSALDTVTAAYNKCTANKGDTVYLLGDGNTSGTARESSLPLTWAKDNTHLVGLGAPCMLSQRTRITPLSGAALTENAVIKVTADACVFSNLAIGHWGSTDAKGTQGLEVAGQRNYFHNLHVVGIGHDNAGDETDSADLLISAGGNENLFERCTFGVDTVLRSTTNASIEVTGAAERNAFIDCTSIIRGDSANNYFIKVDAAADILGFLLFKNCTFINNIEGTGKGMTVALIAHDACGAPIILQNTQFFGVTDVCAHNGNVWTSGVDGTTTGGVGVATT